MVKPPEPMASEADKVTVGPCQPVESYPPIQTFPPAESSNPQGAVPESPTTPVSTEGLASLQNMIFQQQTTHAVDETSRWRLQRLVQKLAKAAQMSFAKGVLQQNHIQFLMKINNEAKVRRSTRPVVLGTAVVMGHEELKAARAKRDEKDAAKEAKGKDGATETKGEAGEEVEGGEGGEGVECGTI
ncbi:hypothetical protein K458DRAFT_387454 [Lentithecium fluviatile CBS 122367]|uniref:Uncharacterized protein n=1 Tax=Lentithecium fluviatile CBS 122367 TaxID=1168545 RepID=A0A6G1J4M1_9PLEO|nr:hypothetical protein K458DRAFT_387454 [Lentithecium fluviatile CBS 122367]